MRTEIVTTARRLVDVGPAWEALWRRGGQSVFQSHGWVAAWWNAAQLHGKSSLCVGLCWDGERLAAVLPCAIRRHRGVRVLEWAAKDCSDYCDALNEPGQAAGVQALEQSWGAMAASGGFDLAYLSHVRPDAALHGLLGGQPQGLQLRLGRRSAKSRQVRVRAHDGQTWFQGIDAAVRSSHAQGMQALGEMGPVRSELHGPGDTIAGVLDQMISLKRQSLAVTGGTYAILDNDAAMFHALAKELARQQALRIFTLHCGTRLIAALLNIMAGTGMQVFFAAHDPHFSQAALEALALVECAIKAFDMGLTEVDLLCVDQAGYSFADAQTDLASYVGARTLAGRLALVVGERR